MLESSVKYSVHYWGDISVQASSAPYKFIMRVLVFSVINFMALTPVSSAQDRVVNDFRGGESIHRLSAIEPLGPGGFQYGAKVQFQRFEVDTLNFDLRMSISYGLYNNLDLTLFLPYYRMTRGNFNKYGQGDGIASFKYSKPKFIIAPLTLGIEGSLLVPTGFKREFIEFPSFTIDQIGYGSRFILQLDSRKVALLGNLGIFATERKDFIETFAGAGVKVNLLSRLLMASCEFTRTYNRESHASFSNTYVGLESHLPYIGLGLTAGADYDPRYEESVALALGATITSRKVLPGVSRGILETRKRYKKVMVFDFLNEDQDFTRGEVKERFKRTVGSLEGVTIVEPPLNIAYDIAAQDREGALQAAGAAGADLLVFCRYQSTGYERSRGIHIPYLIGFPRTAAEISVDLWVVDTKSKEQIYSKRINVRASKLRGVALFPSSRDDLDFFLDASQQETLRRKAIDRFVKNLAVVFSDKFEE